jgi:rhodanese-related sulfurtransferase
MKLPTLLATLLLSTAVALAAAGAATISPKAAAKLLEEDSAVLVDVREPSEWAATGVAAPAVLLPKSDFDRKQKQWKEFLATNRDKQLLLICHSGRRSGQIAEALAKQGMKTANVGAFADWKKAGLPTRKVAAPKK